MWARMNTFTPGMMLLWSGTLADIPAGWALCDGNGGRPNLGMKFVQGALGEEHVGTTGGDTGHTHSLSFYGHSHTMNPAGAEIAAGADFGTVGTENTPDFSLSPASVVPPYVMYAWIIKL